MSDEQKLNVFTNRLGELPNNMRLFSRSMRSLYSENTLSSSSDTAVKMKKLRDDTRKDAVLYVKGVMPISTQVVRSVQSYFEYYNEFTLEEWEENLSDILDEVQGYKKCCSEIVRMHDAVMTLLKAREDEAKVLLFELRELTKEYERRQKELEDSAFHKRILATGLSEVPYVGDVAGPILRISAVVDMSEAVAEKQQGKITEATIVEVSNKLIPALSAFIKGLNAAAGFFSEIENEIINFQTKGEAAMENAKKLHYTMMKKKAREVETSCRAFYAMLPEVRTDLECIPEMPDDQNYVDKWLVQQKEEIEQKYESGIPSGLQKLMKSFTTKDAEQLMIKKN